MNREMVQKELQRKDPERNLKRAYLENTFVWYITLERKYSLLYKHKPKDSLH